MNKQQVTLICDLQYGSTGKGLLAGYLAKRIRPDVIITAWGANAGHTYINAEGEKFVSTMIANGIVSKPEYILIAPGSILNPEKFSEELQMYKSKLGVKNFPTIYIHEHATVIYDSHRNQEEKDMVKIGSTRKGVGASLIQKINRDPENQNVAKIALKGTDLEEYLVDRSTYEVIVDTADHILIEGAQGFDLGMNSGMYPYVTSRECTPAQILSDCCVPAQKLTKTIGVMRTFPIRVANRFDEQGNMIGWSGPSYPDQPELSWEDLGLEPELTTVTKLPRRIFKWSTVQCSRAIRQCRPDEIFLNFCNYCDSTQLAKIINDVHGTGGFIKYFGYGASEKDIFINKPKKEEEN